jgi:PIN domain nuclease of toxin-antitoxin system
LGGARLTTLLLDTRVWAWSLTNDRRISDRARAEMIEAQTILVSAISFFEIAQKARLGKWPEMTR